MRPKHLLFIFAFLSSVCSKAQIVYTDVPDSTVSPWNVYILDMDTASLYIWAHPGTIDINTFDSTTCLLGSSTGTFYPYALQSNQKLNSSSLAWKSPKYHNLSNDGGFWNSSQDRYLGVRFKKQGQYHYGWIRMSVNTATSSFTIKDYAYNSTPNQEIITGSGASSVKTITTAKASIYPNPLISTATLKLDRVLTNATLTIYNVLGETVQSSSGHTGNEVLISRDNLAAGVYNAVLQDSNSSAIVRFVVE